MNGKTGQRQAVTAQRETQTVARGCRELLIKLLILVILIGTLIAGLLGERQNPITIILLVLLILLLLLLIFLQGHLVRLNCALTQPGACVHGDPSLLSGSVLEPIVGTASGLGFLRYELELVHDGVTTIPGALIYADAGGNPDTTLTQGNNQVTTGTLGFVDLQQAAVGAGAAFVTSTSFEVRLHVFGWGGAHHTCSITFEISAARAFMKKVGTAWAHDVLDPGEILRRVEPPTGAPSDPASVGGGVYVRGSANAFGCAGEKIAEVHMWVVVDPGFGFTQPAHGSPIGAPPGGIKISEVLYTTDAQRANNRLDGVSSGGDILTYAPGWTTRTEWVIFDAGIMIPITVPDISEITWPTPASGKFTLLLAVKDIAGNTFFDIQRVWVDNDTPTALITAIGGLQPCEDLKLSSFQGTTCEIRGVAWDPPIAPADPQSQPNDNFDTYAMSFQKNGGGSGAIAPVDPNVRVPNVWPGPIPPGTDGVLADWDIIAALDGGVGPLPAGSAKLARGQRCAYVITLDVYDDTLVGEGPNHHHKQHLYAINIINDL